MKLPISIMIVGYNEEKFLPACFESVSFCDEIVYTDLGSTDNSIAIARNYTTQIYQRAKVPSCEMIQAEVVNYLKNDWVAFIDPDEKVDPSLAEEIKDIFQNITNNPKLGAVMVPWQFYFKSHVLKGTVWGGINKKYFLINRNRFLFIPVVHYGRRLAPGFSSQEINYNGQNNVLHHYWMNSYSVFIKKHLRYLKNEGTDRYNLGVRTGMKKLLLTPFREFYNSVYTSKGYKDGFIGIILSAFWAMYQSAAMVSLYLMQIKNKATSANG